MSPKARRCATYLAQRPCLGEIQLPERVNAPDFAQRPGLGENPVHKIPALESSREGRRAHLRFRRAPRMTKRAFLSQARTMCTIPPNFMFKRPRFSQAGTLFNVSGTTSLLGRGLGPVVGVFLPNRDDAQRFWYNVLAWETLRVIARGFLPRQDDGQI